MCIYLCIRSFHVYLYIYIHEMNECITYLPHEAVAEVSNHKEPIGRGCVDFKWFESQLMSGSIVLNFN